MNINLKGELAIMDSMNLKPNYAALGRKYGMDYRTVKKYHNGYEGIPKTRNKKSKLDETKPISAYVPLGIGVKWMFANRWQLQAVWQQQVYITSIGDRIEGNPELNNSYELNGNNIMNNDLTSSITIGVVFEFWKKGDVCLHCED